MTQEACLRVARLALAYRQQFHKDVVIDMVCYRRHGHNEGDDLSLHAVASRTGRSTNGAVRKPAWSSPWSSGVSLTLDEAEAALADYRRSLQIALDETRQTHLLWCAHGHLPVGVLPHVETGVPRDDRPPLRLPDRLPRGLRLIRSLVRQFEARSVSPRRGRGRVGYR